MKYWWRQPKKQPNRLVAGGFAAAILLGGILLALPVSASTARIPLLDALFTATSAVCVTGLTVRDTSADFSTFGHGVILTLIQLGGLGITTLSTALFLLFGQRTRRLGSNALVSACSRSGTMANRRPLRHPLPDVPSPRTTY